MATENDVNAVVGGQHSSSGPLFNAKSQVKVDTQSLTQMNAQFTTLLSTVTQLRREIPALNNDVDALVKKIQSLGGGRGVAGKGDSVSDKANAMAAKRDADNAGTPASPTAQTVADTAGGGGGRFGKSMGFLNGILQAATPIVGAGMSALDRRIDRGAQYSLSADRMTLLYQQMTGMSQQQVQATYRQPLTQYRLGSEGMSPLLGLQATTGINAALNAPGVQALRTISGFSLGSGDVANMLQSLGSPEVANRMFMMTGQSMYTFGGGQQSGMGVIQNLVQRMGLSDRRVVESGLRQGSVTRARLREAGVPEDMITTVLQYAQQNISFREKGGQGMYDPSNKGHAKLMNIEDNFAMQAEETERVKMEREENFYRRQADNFARLEKTTQSLEREFGRLEDRLSSIIGERVAGRSWQRLLGRGMQIAGGVISLTKVGAAVGIPLMFGGAALAGGGPGDGSGTGSDKGESRGAGASAITKAQGNASFRKMHPKMQERILSMMADNPRLTFGNGWRDSQTQSDMFHQRYEKVATKEEADLEWNGAYWKRVRGVPAAPPGRSMHEIGLAADIHGDDAWLVANAERYGLKTFANVNNEPWHVQPAELPNSRREYEKAGALWGTSETFPFVEGNALKAGGNIDSQGHGADGGSSFGMLNMYNNMPIAEMLEAFRADAVAAILGGSAGASQSSTPTRTKRAVGSLDTRTNSAGALTPEQVARIAWEAGFRGEDLVKMVAISGRESGFRPGAHRTNRDDLKNTESAVGDFGLFQINYKNYERIAAALGLSSIHQLKDPLVNAKAAFMLFAGGAGISNWAVSQGEDGKWKWDRNGDPLGKTNPVAARQAVTNAGLLDAGDGSFDTGFAPQSMKMASSTNMTVSGGDTYNISPVVNIYSSGAGVDVEQIAREIAQVIERDVRVNAMRRR